MQQDVLEQQRQWLTSPGLGDPDAVLEGQRPREAERRVLPEAQPHGARGRVQRLVALVRPQLLHRRRRRTGKRRA